MLYQVVWLLLIEEFSIIFISYFPVNTFDTLIKLLSTNILFQGKYLLVFIIKPISTNIFTKLISTNTLTKLSSTSTLWYEITSSNIVWDITFQYSIRYLLVLYNILSFSIIVGNIL